MLRHMGLNTIASCSGHVGREPHEPYVLFEVEGLTPEPESTAPASETSSNRAPTSPDSS